MVDADQLEALTTSFLTLGRLHLKAPDEATLAAIRGMLDEWPLPAAGHTATGLQALQLSADRFESAQAIRVDHDRLYGVSARAAVAPFESVHRGDDGLVFDVQTLEVRQAYTQLGLEAPNLNREPDDHIGLEFDFIGQALLGAMDAQDNGLDADPEFAVATAFLNEHLLAWAPAMLSKVSELAGTAFMQGVAELSLGALEALTQTLSEKSSL